MEVVPVAFDSMGVRSEATLVKVGAMKIFFDPGVALAPKRFGLSPSKTELKALELAKELVMELAEKCKIVVVTHYHYDHHPYPEDDEMYERCFSGKLVLCKHISKEINRSGRERGRLFFDKVSTLAKEVVFADGEDFVLKKVKLRFSPAVWHGDVGSKVGKVIMAAVEEEERFVFGSDAQSLADPKAKEWFVETKPNAAVIDGYPTLFLGWRFAKEKFEAAKRNLIEALGSTPLRCVILDHHLVRDPNYKEKLKEVFGACRKVKILTAAEYLDLPNLFLESWRRELVKGTRTVDVEAYYAELRTKIMKKIKR